PGLPTHPPRAPANQSRARFARHSRRPRPRRSAQPGYRCAPRRRALPMSCARRPTAVRRIAVAPGYGQTDAPPEIERYTLLHMVGDMVGLEAADFPVKLASGYIGI